MSFEREHAHDSRTVARTGNEDLVPGRASTSAQLAGPAEPIVSGLLQRKARDANGVADDAEAAVSAAACSSGAPLPAPIQRKFEAALGTDLSSVRIHTGEKSTAATKAVGAKAYTVGNDIHFGAGHFDTSSATGQHLLAHEVAHTAQQRGGTPRPQYKLDVSRPDDALEVEADLAADAMVAGKSATVSGASSLSRRVARKADQGLADRMEDEAGYQEQAAIMNPPILLGEASSIDSTHQARTQIAKVQAAGANLFLRKAHWERVNSEAWTYGTKSASDKLVQETQGHIDANDKCAASLQKIVDLGTGHAQVEDQGHRAGYDTRAGAFAALYAVAMADFARVHGVVSAFLQKNPKINAPEEGDMGRAIATGKSDGATTKTHAKVEATLDKDDTLKDLVGELKTRMDAYEGANFSEVINKQIGQFAGATTVLKNVTIKQELDPEYKDTAKQAEAKKKVAKVESDLAAAKAGIDRIGKVVTLATAALGAPAIGALGEASVLTKTIDAAKASPWVSGPGSVAKYGNQASKALADVDIGDKIKTEVGKLMTDYDSRILKATSELEAAKHSKAYKVLQLNKGEMAHAKGEINEKVATLVKTLQDMKKKKDSIRDTASKIRAHQAKHGKKGGPDIAAMARALGECTAFVESAKSAIVQGDEEQKLAQEIADERVKLGGKWNPGTKSHTGIDDNGAPMNVREVFGSSKDAYFDCQTGEPYTVTKKPIEFSIWSDKPMDSPEMARGAIAPRLAELKERVQTVEADKTALSNAMFGEPK